MTLTGTPRMDVRKLGWRVQSKSFQYIPIFSTYTSNPTIIMGTIDFNSICWLKCWWDCFVCLLVSCLSRLRAILADDIYISAISYSSVFIQMCLWTRVYLKMKEFLLERTILAKLFGVKAPLSSFIRNSTQIQTDDVIWIWTL